MKRILTLLAVTMFAAGSSGCCCRGLCPWLDRGAFCGGPAAYSPVAAVAPAPVYQPAMSPQYQYAAPLAATTPNACCTSWDPCQGVVNYGYQGAAAPGCCPTAAAPTCCPTAYAEPGCAYVEPSCAQPYMLGGMNYGPVMSGCTTCAPGVDAGGIVTGPTTVLPGPAQ